VNSTGSFVVEEREASSSTLRPLRSRLREKTPEILIEAASVVLALLLAFGANAWHQHDQEAKLAARAHQAIVAELRSNRAQLDQTRVSVDAAISNLGAAIARLEAGQPLTQGSATVGIPFSPLLPSSAAWQTAQTTGTVGDFDYAWTLKVAKTYEMQALFLTAQQRVIYPPTPTAVPGMEQAGSAAHRMFEMLQMKHELLNMRVLSSFGNALEQTYGGVLDPAAAPAPRKSHG
jgi:hypothetical protein